MSLFKKRNYKIVSLYYATDDFLSKHNEVFAEYLELKEKDFKESSLNYNIENKLDTEDLKEMVIKNNIIGLGNSFIDWMKII